MEHPHIAGRQEADDVAQRFTQRCAICGETLDCISYEDARKPSADVHDNITAYLERLDARAG